MCLFNAMSHCYCYVLNLALGGRKNCIIDWMCNIKTNKQKIARHLDAKALVFKISATLTVFFS